MPKKYNGHPSYAHWNVALWFGNDEGRYYTARESRSGAEKMFLAAGEWRNGEFRNAVFMRHVSGMEEARNLIQELGIGEGSFALMTCNGLGRNDLIAKVQ